MPSSFPGVLVVPFAISYCTVLAPYVSFNRRILNERERRLGLASKAIRPNKFPAAERVHINPRTKLDIALYDVALIFRPRILVHGRAWELVSLLAATLRLVAEPVLPEPDTRSDIINVALDISRDMVLATCDILMASAFILPQVEVSKEEVSSLFCCCVELDPLYKVQLQAN